MSEHKIDPGNRYNAEIFTGIRPTSELTIANHLGAVQEIIDLQEEFEPLVFVADVHGLTDQTPQTIAEHRMGVVSDYLALGVNPEKTTIFMQSHILKELSAMTLLMSREMTLNELTNVPTLKDKLGDEDDPLSARVMLGLYPILMASDILAQKAHQVPVGKDQIAHIELTRRLARRFNDRHGEVFPIPKAYISDENKEPLKILSLKSDGKMSKSQPNGAIFLSDSAEIVSEKLRTAQTGAPGENTAHIDSLFQIARGISSDSGVLEQVDDLYDAHSRSEQVMKDFKKLLSTIISDFLAEYQTKKATFEQNPDFVQDVITTGNVIAKRNAESVLNDMQEAMRF